MTACAELPVEYLSSVNRRGKFTSQEPLHSLMKVQDDASPLYYLVEYYFNCAGIILVHVLASLQHQMWH